MNTFGDRLRSEREERGLSIRSVAETLGVPDDRLRALERNDFRALPGNETLVPWLRAYADCLRVDAELMIEDYVRERDRCLAELDRAVTATESEARGLPRILPSALARPPAMPRWALGAAVVILVLAGAWWILSGEGARSLDEGAPASPADVAAPIVQAEQPAPPALPRTGASAPAAAAASGGVLVVEEGVGTGIEHRQLVGRAERFSEGTQVWYWTRVEGGRVGDRVEHVWLRDGVEAERMSLRIGGSPWRTYSAKVLRAGSAGPWVVEARDPQDRVLARREFTCIR